MCLDEDFTIKDLIVLQDPRNVERRQVSSFHYIKKDIDISNRKIAITHLFIEIFILSERG